MRWKWTDHILIQLEERNISKETVVAALDSPDILTEGKKNRIIYNKAVGDKLIRVVTEEDALITAYLTDKIAKYMKGAKS